MRIRIGNEFCLPNQGIAQGSLISPSLFNTEGLFKGLELETEISEENLFGYADDILITCEDIKTISKVIEVVRNWSSHHNMKINKKNLVLI